MAGYRVRWAWLRLSELSSKRGLIMAFSANLVRALGVGSLLALAGCGGGGGGSDGVASVGSARPAPSPVTPANLSPSTSFSNSMQSGNFVTIRASGFTTITPSGNTSTSVVKVSPADTTNYISYDAASNLYIMNATDAYGQLARQAFYQNPSDTQVTIIANGTPDPTDVNYAFRACYFSGCRDDNYLVTHSGSGSFTYNYTAIASIHETSLSFIDSARSISDDFSVFGFPTLASAVPRTGSATYALDLMGSYPGTGSGSVDFGSGRYNFSGTIAQSSGSVQTTGTFRSTGTLASASNGFSGTVNLAVNQTLANPTAPATQIAYTYSGPIGGMFFGPAAQELGGTFVASVTSSSSTAAGATSPAPVYGAILGHR